MIEKIQNVDIVIIGSGITGLALACGLQGIGFHVVVIENDPLIHTTLHATSQSQVSVINIASKKLLSHLGVWSEIVNSNISCFRSMEVWEKDGFGRFTIDAEGTGYIYLGYIVENEVILDVLKKKVYQCRDIQILTSVIIQKVEWSENDVFVTFRTGEKLSSRLLIGADGEHSWLRRRAGIPIARCSYQKHVLVTTVRTTEMHESVVRKVFQNDEILSFLPLRDPNLSCIIWSLNLNKAQKMLKTTTKTFNQELCISFDNRLGLCFLASERKVLSLTNRYVQSFASHRLALIGDAAYTIYPMDGQDVNVGFMDVAELLGELRRLQKERKDIGQYIYLRRYELKRKYSSSIQLASIQIICKILLGEHTIKKSLRNITIKVIDTFPNLKKRILRKVIGTHDLPEWLR